MRDRFYSRTWTLWVAACLSAILGLGLIVMGIGFWSGSLGDADAQEGTENGPRLTIAGCCMLAWAALGATKIVRRRVPTIRCHREGIECNLVGVTSLDGVPLVPAPIRMAWALLSLQGFRAQRIRILWPQFFSALVADGILALHWLPDEGSEEGMFRTVEFKEGLLVDELEEVAASVNLLAENAVEREGLPAWQRASPPPLPVGR